MQRHPKIGERILESVNFPWDLKPLVLSHHEHFDGSGYPSGLKGEEIPLGARILAIAEAYEIMTTGRIYKRALSPLEASKSLTEGAGSHFDPQLVAPFLESLDSDRKV
jgi:putative two-component system response regulator